MDMLARREFGRQELVRKLAPKVEAPELMESVVAKLVDEGLLCDDRYTEAYTRSRWRKGFGPVRIALELREKGVSEDLISKHIKNNDDLWFALIAQVAKKNTVMRCPMTLLIKRSEFAFTSIEGLILIISTLLSRPSPLPIRVNLNKVSISNS